MKAPGLGEVFLAMLKLHAARLRRPLRVEPRDLTLQTESDMSFDRLAAKLRRLTTRRPQTPAEFLMREGCDER